MQQFRPKTDSVGAIYDRITALIDEGVWVPAVGNGALRNLVEELVARGWRIIPPNEEEMSGVLPPRPCACGQGLWLDHEQGSYCG